MESEKLLLTGVYCSSSSRTAPTQAVTHKGMSASSSRVVLQGIGYDPAVGPRATGAIGGSTSAAGSSSQHNSPSVSHIPIVRSPRALTTNIVGSASGLSNSIYDRNLHRAKHEISLSSLSFLFMEMISVNLNNSKSLIELERKLNNLGYTIGVKYLELTSLRVNFNNNLTSSGKSNTAKRETKILEVLHFIVSTLWKNLFGKQADNLERSSEYVNQYMIIDNSPMLSQFISVPKQYESLNCEAFVGGLVEGVLDSCYLSAEVSAHTQPVQGCSNRTVYLIKFDQSILKREARK